MHIINHSFSTHYNMKFFQNILQGKILSGNYYIENQRRLSIMDNKKVDYLIVGSGAGGATLAKELSNKGNSVLILEKGNYEKKLGTFQDSLRFYDANRLTKIPRKSKEGVIIWRTIMAGGSTVVSCGNGTRCLQKELLNFGIDLEEEFIEAEKEMKIKPMSEEFLSAGSKNIMQAAKELGYEIQPMLKFIDPEKCKNCGQCVFGCSRDAKWTALNYLDKAIEQGTQIEYNISVERILSDNGKAIGVRGVSQNGRQDYFADIIILAAGGLGTPVILQNSGVQNAGSGLFIDLFMNTYGVTNGINQKNEPVMALIDSEFHDKKGFILSTYINTSPMVRFIELGPRGFTLPTNRLIGIMNKTTDEANGHVYANGTISKPITDKDWQRLKEGSAISKEILLKAGAKSNSILFSKVQGAHPGGTTAIGKIVDKDLQTEIKNLYVCDASVLPRSPGLPPILTICALAKKLTKRLSKLK